VKRSARKGCEAMEMRKAVTGETMREIDRRAIEEFGIPSLLLMENAGRACAEEILKRGVKAGERVAVFAGKGNNGGDGFVAARHLHNGGVVPVVFFFQKPSEMKADPLANFRILERMKIDLRDCAGGADWDGVRNVLKTCRAVLDALFGTGLSKPVGEPFRTAIEEINHSKLPVVAVDIPSGLHADTGEVMGICVKAAVTVSLALAKKGFYLNEGPAYTGSVVVADISIPRELIEGVPDEAV